MATPYRGEQTAEVTVEASFDAFPPFFADLFYVYGGIVKKLEFKFIV